MTARTQARSQLARAVQTGQAPEVIADLRRRYRAARLEYQILDAISDDGLTEDQRAHCARVLLRGGDAHAA